MICFFFFQAEDGIRDYKVTGVQTCALPISGGAAHVGLGAVPQRTVGRSGAADARFGRGAAGRRRSALPDRKSVV